MESKRTQPAWLFATFFGAGYFPKGPGTAGSLAAVILAIPFVCYDLPPWLLCAASFVLLYPAIAASDIVAREASKKDPQIIVIDEVLGQWLTLAGAQRLNWRSLLIGFVLFRIFDILKPPPVRQLERVPGGAGIVLDDMMAGVYGALVLYAAGWYFY